MLPQELRYFLPEVRLRLWYKVASVVEHLACTIWLQSFSLEILVPLPFVREYFVLGSDWRLKRMVKGVGVTFDLGFGLVL